MQAGSSMLVCVLMITHSIAHSLLYSSLLHVDVARGFLQAVVADDVGLHGVVTVAILSIDELAHARRARPVHLVLVQLLNLLRRVAEHLAILRLLCVLRLGEAIVQHVLIVLHDGRIATELVIESILCVRQNVSLVAHSCSVGLVSVREDGHVILAQVGVESALGVGGSVVHTQTA